jgi:fumarate hydratase class I/fumarate hydratase subunit alpha
MLAPGAGVEGVVEFVLQAVREKAANACPPLVVGVGVGGTFDKVAGLAKHALLRKVELTAITVGTPSTTPGSAKPGQNHPLEKGELKALEERLLKEVTALGIGPGGFGGWPTALAVHVETAPCHIAALPVAVNMGCSAMRSSSIDLLSGEVLV